MKSDGLADYSKERQIPYRFAGGAKKISILVDDVVYMLKFPDRICSKTSGIPYAGNVFSEHISCRIFESCDIPAQETSIGVYTGADGKTRPVVSCRDLTADGSVLQEFGRIPQERFDSGPSPYRRGQIELQYVYDLIRSSRFVANPEKVIEGFWDIFVVDALTMNPDRHLENWALAYQLGSDGGASMSPVYGCGSSLFARTAPDKQLLALEDLGCMDRLVAGICSCFAVGGEKINYLSFFKTSTNRDFLAAVRRIAPRIDLDVIDAMVDDTPLLSSEAKSFYEKALHRAYSTVIQPAWDRALP